MESLARSENTVHYDKAYCCKQEKQFESGCTKAVSKSSVLEQNISPSLINVIWFYLSILRGNTWKFLLYLRALQCHPIDIAMESAAKIHTHCHCRKLWMEWSMYQYLYIFVCTYVYLYMYVQCMFVQYVQCMYILICRFNWKPRLPLYQQGGVWSVVYSVGADVRQMHKWPCEYLDKSISHLHNDSGPVLLHWWWWAVTWLWFLFQSSPGIFPEWMCSWNGTSTIMGEWMSARTAFLLWSRWIQNVQREMLL